MAQLYCKFCSEPVPGSMLHHCEGMMRAGYQHASAPSMLGGDTVFVSAVNLPMRPDKKSR